MRIPIAPKIPEGVRFAAARLRQPECQPSASVRDELRAARHPLDLLATEQIVELLDARVRGVAGHLLDPEVRVRDARDLRKVRDGEHLRALGEALQRRRDRVRRHAADPRVDLVEDERLAAGHRRERERDARQLAARGRVRDRRERQAGVRADEERRLVASGRTDLALAKLDEELALAHAERGELVGDGLGETLRVLPRACARSASASAATRSSYSATARRAASTGSPPSAAPPSSRSALAASASSSA